MNPKDGGVLPENFMVELCPPHTPTQLHFVSDLQVYCLFCFCFFTTAIFLIGMSLAQNEFRDYYVELRKLRFFFQSQFLFRVCLGFYIIKQILTVFSGNIDYVNR